MHLQSCEILCVGTELLMGQIVNTDAQYIARRLSELGISLYRTTVVGDNALRLKQALNEALSRADLVITTGGLGPTEDDLTKETVAEAFGLPMVREDAQIRQLEETVRRYGRECTPNQYKQADIPLGARVMPNRCGTAPGCIVEKDGKAVAILPGPPAEMQDMFENALTPYLQQRTEAKLVSRFLHVFGIGESKLEMLLKDLFHSDNPTLALYCAPGEVLARLTARCATDEAARALLEPVEAEILRRVGPCYYGEGRDLTIAGAVLALLHARKETVTFAESCTGGMIAASLVDCAGASEVFKQSFVTYCDEAKHALLNVSEETLKNHTAVSAQCAEEMAFGARKASGADWGVSVTGYAGPDGGTKEHPAGTVFIGVSGSCGTQSFEFHFSGDRKRVRTCAASHALNSLRLKLLDVE